MRSVIRLDVPASHGGKVVSVDAQHFTVDGIPVARVGDVRSCPINDMATARSPRAIRTTSSTATWSLMKGIRQPAAAP